MGHWKSTRGNASRERIRTAACSLLRKEGISAVAMRRVAAAVGVPHSSIQFHCGSQDEFIRQVISWSAEDVSRELHEEAEGTRGLARTMRLCRAWLKLSDLREADDGSPWAWKMLPPDDPLFQAFTRHEQMGDLRYYYNQPDVLPEDIAAARAYANQQTARSAALTSTEQACADQQAGQGAALTTAARGRSSATNTPAASTATAPES